MAETTPEAWAKVAREEDIDRGRPLGVVWNNRGVAVYRTAGPSMPPATPALTRVRSGRAIKMPANAPIEVFPVRGDGGDVFLASDER